MLDISAPQGLGTQAELNHLHRRRAEYAFPVSLGHMYTEAGREVPGVRAVIRDDTGSPISTVSSHYRLIPHETVISQAYNLVRAIGAPTETFYISGRGATVVGEFTYKERGIEIKKGDIAGLRVFVQNSYNGKRSYCVKIGALILSCLNGAMFPKTIFEFGGRHIGDDRPLEFPTADQVIEAYRNGALNWRVLAETALPAPRYTELLEEAYTVGLVADKGREYLRSTPADTYWDLMQNLTYFTTHLTPKMSPIGRMARLERVSRWVTKQAIA